MLFSFATTLADVIPFQFASLVNRAKIPERNRVGFGNIPWKDEGTIDVLNS